MNSRSKNDSIDLTGDSNLKQRTSDCEHGRRTECPHVGARCPVADASTSSTLQEKMVAITRRVSHDCGQPSPSMIATDNRL